ncbi:MAG: hypothetical protein ACLQBX_06990 [Candidatus Limnocylindrales bacterium]
MTTTIMANELSAAHTRQTTKEFRLRLTNEDGRTYYGRFDGVLLAEDGDHAEVYKTDAGNVLLYDPENCSYVVVEDPEEDLQEVLPSGAFIEVMAALGICATVDLDV